MRLILAPAVCLPLMLAVSLSAAAQQRGEPHQERPAPAAGPQRGEPQFTGRRTLPPPMRGMPQMEANLAPVERRPTPDARACNSLSGLEPGDRVLAIQPLDFDGHTQCRVKVMRSDGMVRVRVIDP